MTKEKFFDWLDEQIKVFEQVKEIVERTGKFEIGQTEVRNIQFAPMDNMILIRNLWQVAKILDVQLDFEPIEDEAYAGKCFLKHKGYVFIDFVRKDKMR